MTELRSAYVRSYEDISRTRYLAGETAQCSVWYPPIEIPVGFGQTRSAKQLPVLTMITGYSRWLSAILIPSSRTEDLFAGWWQLIAELGAVPHVLTVHNEEATGSLIDGQVGIAAECSKFCRSLGADVVVGRVGDPATTGLIERAQAYLERSFLRGRTFSSPEDFNVQLRDWLAMTNTRHREPPNCSPVALVDADRKAMLPLPPMPSATGWQLSVHVGECPFVRFDSNDYSVPRALIGRTVELLADLTRVRVLCDGKLAAEHDRAWAHKGTIVDHQAVRCLDPGKRS